MHLCNAFNFYLCVLGSVSVFFTEAFSSFHFKGNYFITLYKIINDLSFNDSFYIAAYRKFAVIINKQYFAEFNFVANLALKVRNVQILTFLDFKLLTGYFYNC